MPPPQRAAVPFFRERIRELTYMISSWAILSSNAGVSRSVSTVIGFLMTERLIGFQEAYDLVKKARPAAQPNEGFRRQLIAYEEAVRHSVDARPKILPVHKLHAPWTLWFDRKMPNRSYGENLKKLGTFDSIEGLWE